MTHNIFEQVSFSGRKAKDRIDRTNKVIRGVKIVGRKSQNSAASTFGAEFADSQGGYEYAPQAMRDAVPLVEGARVNLNHVDYVHTRGGKVQTGDHKVEDRFGRLSGVHYVDGNDETAGLYGNLEYLSSHPHADMVLEAAERMPETIALSWHAEGKQEKQPGGRVVVTKISRVRSVDLIGGRPGTNKSLFERADMNSTIPPANQPHKIMTDALKNAIIVIYDDMSLNSDQKLDQIKKLLKFKEKAAATLAPPSQKTVTENADDDMDVAEALELPPAGSTLLEEHFDDMRISISPRIF